MDQKTFKEIVQQTNKEFTKEFLTWIPTLGAILSIVFAIAVLIVCFNESRILGFTMIPVVTLTVFWLFRFFGNIRHYWRYNGPRN